ncbi:hypothetical protein CLOM_g20 [Closterium sp. NIES-68]|nr:hypothetical protein CLOM_g20 [Closterium sp. NIES-68]GJP73571.1 hypothetical protein CLOP_g4264 [Closterium sp. NIES-67]
MPVIVRSPNATVVRRRALSSHEMDLEWGTSPETRKALQSDSRDMRGDAGLTSCLSPPGGKPKRSPDRHVSITKMWTSPIL